MDENKPYEDRTALPFVLPFVLVYALLFLYPTCQMVAMSLTNAQLTVPGEWVGLGNYVKLIHDWRFGRAIGNTASFALMTVVPSTLLGLLIAMMVNRLSGVLQSVVLALFFLPYVLPVSVVANIVYWLVEPGGPLNHAVGLFIGEEVSLLRKPRWVLPIVAITTVWWTIGFNILLFLAGLKNISPEIYEAATLDNAGRSTQFRLITWPLIWPVTALVLTIQLILQIKVFDQVYLMTGGGGGVDSTLVLVQHIYNLAFQKNQGGYASTVAVALFVIVAVCSVLQFQMLRARSQR